MIGRVLLGLLLGVGAVGATALARRWRFVPWMNVVTRSGELHTLPVEDLVEHDLDDDCVCGPTGEAVPRADGSIGWHYVHHSLDGREQETA